MAKAKSKTKYQSRSSSSSIGVATLAHAHYIKSWQVIVFIVIVMFAGIIIIRLSRAATSEVTSTPLTDAEIQQVAGGATIAQTGSPIPVSGTVIFGYNTTRLENVGKVGFYVDGTLAGVATKTPYSFTFDSTRYSAGQHTISAIAFDTSNRPLAAVKKTIAIDNSPNLLKQLGNIITYPFYVLTARP
ncbi:Ig-like domain-containing protein [Candidatus Saccharibacteria bacterium]|nr:Ig-like domain-containing protein [Candidatus Saccharibacteria bacterium]